MPRSTALFLNVALAVAVLAGIRVIVFGACTCAPSSEPSGRAFAPIRRDIQADIEADQAQQAEESRIGAQQLRQLQKGNTTLHFAPKKPPGFSKF